MNGQMGGGGWGDVSNKPLKNVIKLTKYRL